MRAGISYDVAIVGGGHNGLVCAAYLSAAGISTIVLEKNPIAGGAASTEEFHPGFRNSVAAYTVSLLNPKIIADLQLACFGLRIVERPVANFWPIDDRRSLLMPHDSAGRRQAVAAFSRHDAERLADYDDALERAAGVLKSMILETPPNAGGGVMDALRGARLGRRLLGLDLQTQRTVTDLFSKSVADYLDHWFESDVVKAAFAFDGIVGAYASPFSPGTSYVLLHHCFGEVNGKRGMWGHAIGGMGAISDALVRSAEARGAVVRTDAMVSEVVIDGDRAVGVRLQSGELVRARAVASNVGPKLLFRDLVAADAIEPELRSRLIGVKTGSGTFRMNVALAALPDFPCRPGGANGTAMPHHGAGIVIGPSIDYLDRAYADARKDGWSREPVIEMVIPSVVDAGLAPAGGHVASLFVQHVSPKLPEPRSWADDSEKERFADLVIDTVTRYAPNFRSSVLGRQVLSPLDLERRFGMVDGDIFHGQLTLDQLYLMRPVLGLASYRMPLNGLYLCGSGAHPGGGVTGAPGHNAAREIIRDLKRQPPWLRR